jgi:polysaccharide biosynthesis/export protein
MVRSYPTRLTICLCLATLILPLSLHENVHAQSTGYRIGPGDVLSLRIFAGGEEQHAAQLTVSSQGTINVPFIGSVKAQGLTVSQLEKNITAPLAADYLVDPEVTITVNEYHSLQYTISGAVGAPGLYEMKSQPTLMELIAKAGGLTANRGNVAYILRPSNRTSPAKTTGAVSNSAQPPQKVDLKKLLDQGDMSQNMVLQSGDVVYVPLSTSLNLAESKIYVEGEVQNPGAYDYQEGMTALSACIMAGGFSKFAAPNRARIIRQNGDEQKVIKIDLEDVKEGKIQDIKILPGDRIHIPETWL